MEGLRDWEGGGEGHAKHYCFKNGCGHAKGAALIAFLRL